MTTFGTKGYFVLPSPAFMLPLGKWFVIQLFGCPQKNVLLKIHRFSGTQSKDFESVVIREVNIL